jgi:hypothetical protein
MRTSVTDVLPELLDLVLYGGLSVAFSVAGVYIERFAMATLQGGDTMLGLWAVVVGLLAFVFAYVFTTQHVLDAVATLQAHVAGET